MTFTCPKLEGVMKGVMMTHAKDMRGPRGGGDGER